MSHPLLLSFILCFLMFPLFSQTGYLKESPKLAYWEVGKKREIVIVLHGGPSVEHSYLRPEFDGLKKAAKVIYFDQRGCGKSDLATSYLWEDHVQDIKRLIQKHAPGQKVFLAGSSWGSLLALLYAYHHPEDVKGLLLSGLVQWFGKGWPADHEALHLPEGDPNNLQPAQITKLTLEEQKLVWLRNEQGRRTQQLVPIVKEVTRYRGRMGSHPISSMATAPVIDSLQHIQLPALIFNGSQPCRYYERVNRYGELLPNSEIVYFEGACHDPWLSDPTQFQRLSNRFIRKHKK